MTKTLTLKEYQQMLIEHDWYYMMTEDPSVYKRGCYTYSNIKELSETSKEHEELFNIFKDKHKID